MNIGDKVLHTGFIPPVVEMQGEDRKVIEEGIPSGLEMEIKEIKGDKAVCTWQRNSKIFEKEFPLDKLILK